MTDKFDVYDIKNLVGRNDDTANPDINPTEMRKASVQARMSAKRLNVEGIFKEPAVKVAANVLVDAGRSRGKDIEDLTTGFTDGVVYTVLMLTHQRYYPK